MLSRFRNLLSRDHHAVHLVGAQLAVAALMSASLAIAAVPGPKTVRISLAGQPRVALALAQAVPDAAGQDGDPAGEAAVIRLQDLAPDAARAWNASNPISKLPNPAAKPFRLDADGVLDEARAVDCMTAAIYYEAANESPDGQRAVAQVVLNRMRHPAFPKTVCGVVFQGSGRQTGCQFTFTCDGALGRKAADASWARARGVAEAALSGYVMKKVGNATHYHADYVAPYWSPSLVKVGQIGAHIFYRWTGGMGLPPAFGGRYAGGEMNGLQIATLDGLGKTQARLALSAAGPDAAAHTASAAVEEAAPRMKLAAAGKAADAQGAEPELITAASVAQDAQAITRPEDLDWQGHPKAKGPPRLAMPSAGSAF